MVHAHSPESASQHSDRSGSPRPKEQVSRRIFGDDFDFDNTTEGDTGIISIPDYLRRGSERRTGKKKEQSKPYVKNLSELAEQALPGEGDASVEGSSLADAVKTERVNTAFRRLHEDTKATREREKATQQVQQELGSGFIIDRLYDTAFAKGLSFTIGELKGTIRETKRFNASKIEQGFGATLKRLFGRGREKETRQRLNEMIGELSKKTGRSPQEVMQIIEASRTQE